MIRKPTAIAVFLCLLIGIQGPETCFSFLLSPSPNQRAVRHCDSRRQRLNLSEDLPLLGEECEAVTGKNGHSQSILESLRERQNQLEKGIGKRYVCRTQKGFLNVHKEPGEPFNPYNIVNQLNDGDIVTSTGPPRGGWIHHDNGGWSISVYNGFTWLEELKE